MTAATHVDVLLVGAGITGIGGAYHLKTNFPSKRFLVLDEQDQFGGTWWTHRYPGIRSDSELYTFGYRFKPWTGKPIAARAEILRYLQEVIAENGLASQIRYRHRVVQARWCSQAQQWEVEAVQTHSGERVRFSANFLWMGQGYYRHDAGYMPQWPGQERFQGLTVHPQQWPEDLDLTGKKVVVIGSGATAATLIPAIAAQCEHVTMLQRSPSYFRSARNLNSLADTLRELDVPEAWTHEIVRRQVLKEQGNFVQRAMAQPDEVRSELLAEVERQLGTEMLQQHFTPHYAPWRQRVAFVPDGDLFAAIRSGRAGVVTDEIEAFSATGIVLRSGEILQADVVVTATGLNLNVMGDIQFEVDGRPVDFSRCVGYRGAMFTGVPNMLWVFGYFRASWTLRVDLLGDYLCRLLRHMDTHGLGQVLPQLREADRDMPLLPWVESGNFNPGYLSRMLDQLPRQGATSPWKHTQDYWCDAQELPLAGFDDGALQFTARHSSSPDDKHEMNTERLETLP